MTTYISILRGINVAGHNQIKMDALKRLYISLGYSDVQSFIQSGNVIFRSVISDTHALEESITENILKEFGFKVPVLALTVEELKTALQNNPFILESTKDPAFIHLTFLSALPDKALLEKISADIFKPDEYNCLGKIVYLYCPTGYGRTKLNNTFFESKLKLTATTRNLKTATELLSLAEKFAM